MSLTFLGVKARAEKSVWPPGFVKYPLCLNNGVLVEGCVSSPAGEGVAGRVAVCGVSVESTHQACVCWRVGLKPALAFSSYVALVKSQAL